MKEHLISTINASKMYWIQNLEYAAISFSEAYYLATKSGGAFFGKLGSFERGYMFDALGIDDSNLSHYEKCSLEERLEKLIYAGNRNNIVKRYVLGREIKKTFSIRD